MGIIALGVWAIGGEGYKEHTVPYVYFHKFQWFNEYLLCQIDPKIIGRHSINLVMVMAQKKMRINPQPECSLHPQNKIILQKNKT